MNYEFFSLTQNITTTIFIEVIMSYLFSFNTADDPTGHVYVAYYPAATWVNLDISYSKEGGNSKLKKCQK